jgi:hypothetical protein
MSTAAGGYHSGSHPFHTASTILIPIEAFEAEFPTSNGNGKTTWHRCRVVGVDGEPSDLKFVVIVSGPTLYADVVGEIRRLAPTAKPLE